MTAQVRLLDEAIAELGDASAWYEEQQTGLGLVFVAAVDRAIDRVQRWPPTGTLIGGVDESLEVRRMKVGSCPYCLAYISTEPNITVLAVAHQRRRPRHWSSRADHPGQVRALDNVRSQDDEYPLAYGAYERVGPV